jgi:hypothetical protein
MKRLLFSGLILALFSILNPVLADDSNTTKNADLSQLKIATLPDGPVVDPTAIPFGAHILLINSTRCR